jgi:hypothetical protein
VVTQLEPRQHRDVQRQVAHRAAAHHEDLGPRALAEQVIRNLDDDLALDQPAVLMPEAGDLSHVADYDLLGFGRQVGDVFVFDRRPGRYSQTQRTNQRRAHAFLVHGLLHFAGERHDRPGKTDGPFRRRRQLKMKRSPLTTCSVAPDCIVSKVNGQFQSQDPGQQACRVWLPLLVALTQWVARALLHLTAPAAYSQIRLSPA